MQIIVIMNEQGDNTTDLIILKNNKECYQQLHANKIKNFLLIHS